MPLIFRLIGLLAIVLSSIVHSATLFADDMTDVLGKIYGPRRAAAMIAWDNCTKLAAEKFASQPEPAQIVAQAAMAACHKEAGEYMITAGIQWPKSVEEATMPDLLAYIMSIRATRQK